jgi:hypothetical protein
MCATPRAGSANAIGGADDYNEEQQNHGSTEQVSPLGASMTRSDPREAL